MDLTVFEKALGVIVANEMVCPLADVHKDFSWCYGNTEKEGVLLQFGNDIFHVMLVIPTEYKVPPRALAQLFDKYFCSMFVKYAESKVNPHGTVVTLIELMEMKAGLSRWVEEIKQLTEKSDYNGVVDFEFCVSFVNEVEPITGAGVTVIASSEEEYKRLKPIAEAMKQQREEAGHEYAQLH